ncbi:MAG: toxin-activating lysine-acyltransferase [Cyanobacteria bacterium P01_D01_bin.36]
MVTQSSDAAILDRGAAQNSANFSHASQLLVKSSESPPEPECIQFSDTRELLKPSGRMQQRLQMLGSIVCLMQNSSLHRRYTIAELEERFIPSLLHNQFRYYEIDGTPIGFVNWAWLDEETEEKYKTGDYELALDEWVGGSSLWFPEFVAPYGHARKMVADLRANVHKKGTPAKALRISQEGELMGIAKYRL